MWTLSVLLFIAAAFGSLLIALQLIYVRRFARRAPRKPSRTPAISILKPLCGVDDSLEENLRSFAALDYPDYEVLLGLETTTDRAFPIARAIVARWPKRFRIVFQKGAPGYNPKVNQLITLAREARHDILVVSDSNVRVEPLYLSEIAAILEDPEVALVGHPIAGIGEKTLGSLLDNLYMTTHCSVGLIATKEFCGQDVVIGKSMAFRRADLEALGGFESVKDVLAEDWVMGRRIRDELGRKVAYGRCVIRGICERRTVPGFMDRYGRWMIMQSQVLSPITYTLQVLVYPMVLAALGFLVHPNVGTLAAFLGFAGLKIALDLARARMLRPGGFPLSTALFVPLQDAIIGWCWLQGFFRDQVTWRGHLLEVLPGSFLRPVHEEDALEDEEIEGLPAQT